MDIQIIDKPLNISIYGYASTVENNNFGDTGFRLMNKMWETIRGNNLSHKGLNTWVYEGSNKLFTGVELADAPHASIGLEFKTVELDKYAYYKHIGPYSLIKTQGAKVLAELNNRVIATTPLYIEIYGHWTNDETKSETELIWEIK